jgi:hypothetical protein
MSAAVERLKSEAFSTFIAALCIGAIIGLCALLSWHTKRSEDPSRYCYNRFHAVVVEINANQEHISEDKFHNLQLVNMARFRIIDHRYPANTFFIIRGSESRLITDSWVYNHHVGDTVYFDYIRDSRTFLIRGQP